eukprot:maker-scaffold1179_size56971-snap-gene-0.14 protein:Tk06631 transcript:maker-scaffold1179_size56971-snap-gene-0.14-mRNA-1 annotation:"phospholipase B "
MHSIRCVRTVWPFLVLVSTAIAQNGPNNGVQMLANVGDNLVAQPIRNLVAGGVAGTTMINTILVQTTNGSNQVLLNQRNRRSCLFPSNVPFPCRYIERSKYPPQSVHRLQPGDIQVVAALGDSLTAGTGAMARDILEVRNEYRGSSFSIGGDGSWREYVTLPNILKNFNPSLYGFSQGITRVGSQDLNIGFNLAVSGDESDDTAAQATRLVYRLKSDPHVNFHEDWKMVTLFVGHNDICSHSCSGFKYYEDKPASSHNYGDNVRAALDVLHEHLPRTFVNLIPPGNIAELLDIYRKPLPCQISHPIFCPCVFDEKLSEPLTRRRLVHFLRSYHQQLRHLVQGGRYDTRDDFTVVLQPITLEAKLPRTRSHGRGPRGVDLNYLSPDCFHWSQKVHAVAARALWNNLLEPLGHKSTSFNLESKPFLCPTERFPYLATAKNNARESSQGESPYADNGSLLHLQELARDFAEMMAYPQNQQLTSNCPL